MTVKEYGVKLLQCDIVKVVINCFSMFLFIINSSNSASQVMAISIFNMLIFNFNEIIFQFFVYYV